MCDEELAANRLVWFVVVWIALGLFAYDSIKGASETRRSAGVFG